MCHVWGGENWTRSVEVVDNLHVIAEIGCQVLESVLVVVNVEDFVAKDADKISLFWQTLFAAIIVS